MCWRKPLIHLTLHLTEEWNGTNWAETGDLNNARGQLAGAGTKTAALVFGGDTGGPNVNNVEKWNGSNWTEVNDLNTTRDQLAGTGTYEAALAFGGDLGPPGTSADVELYNGTNWAEQANLSAGRRALAGSTSGGTSSGLAFGGEGPPLSAVTNEWTGAGSGVTRTFTDS